MTTEGRRLNGSGPLEWSRQVVRLPRLIPSWLRSTCIALLCLSPLGWLLWALMHDQLGPDPAKLLMQGTGEWALRGLAVVLLATPMAKWGWPGLFRYRRMLGLCVFLYVSLHLLLFAQVYVGWSATLLLEELQDRPYVLVGFTAWLALLPLALTSTHRARKALGRSWRQLHRLIYPAAVLAWLHLFWLARSDWGEALLYGAVLGGLLAWRVRRQYH